jgi:hypothetical protein
MLMSATALLLVAAMLLMAANEIAVVADDCQTITLIIILFCLFCFLRYFSISAMENPLCKWLKTRGVLTSSTRCGLLEPFDLPHPPFPDHQGDQRLFAVWVRNVLWTCSPTLSSSQLKCGFI